MWVILPAREGGRTVKRTKKQIIAYAQERGYSSHYSGKLRKFFFKKLKNVRHGIKDVHELINEKQTITG